MKSLSVWWTDSNQVLYGKEIHLPIAVVIEPVVGAQGDEGTQHEGVGPEHLWHRLHPHL